MAQQFYFLAEQCLNLIQKSMLPVLKDFGLNHSQHLILLILWYSDFSRNEIISTDLAYLLGLERHSVSAIIDTLSKEGLIRRQRNKKDRRIVNLKLSEKGRKLVAEHQPKTIKKVVFPSGITESDYKFLFSFLESLRELAADNNDQSPSVYSSAYNRLLLEGQKEFLQTIDKEMTHV